MASSKETGLEQRLTAVLSDYSMIAAAYLFGSCARGEPTPHSDLDVGLVLLDRGDTFANHHRELLDLANRLEQAGGRTVDLVLLEEQGPVFCHRVLSEGKLVHEALPARRIDFESVTLIRYFDWQPTWESARRHSLQGYRSWLEQRQ